MARRRPDVAQPADRWVALPTRRHPRLILPVTTNRLAYGALAAYHPVTRRGLAGWTAARLAARLGAFRLLPATAEPPELAAIRAFFPTATIALHVSHRPGRQNGLVLNSTGDLIAAIKLASDPVGIAQLERRARWIRELGSLLRPPVAAPQIIRAEPGLLCCQAGEWRARIRAWELPEEAASALGAMYRRGGGTEDRGPAHGDFAPWNLLHLSAGGWLLIDWEDATGAGLPFQDPFHWIVQAHTWLARPGTGAIISGLHGEGWIGRALDVYAADAGLQRVDRDAAFRTYLERTATQLESAGPTHKRQAEARRALLVAMAGRGASQSEVRDR